MSLNINDLMKSAQLMKDQMKNVQENLAKVLVEGIAKGGLVKVVISCHYEMKSVEIQPSLLNEPKEIIQDLIMIAMQDALDKVEKKNKTEMSKITGGVTDFL